MTSVDDARAPEHAAEMTDDKRESRSVDAHATGQPGAAQPLGGSTTIGPQSVRLHGAANRTRV